MNTKKNKLTNAREFGVFLVLVIIMIIMSITSPVFLKTANLVNIVRQTVEIGIMAIGMTYLIRGTGSFRGISVCHLCDVWRASV